MSKELVESIVVDDADAIVESFNAIMAEKIADALEVRRVELASGIMDEAVVVHDKDGNPVGRYKNIETAKLLKPTSDGYTHSQDDRIFNKYSGKYPGGNKQKKADKAAFMKRFAKEEAEQIDELDRKTYAKVAGERIAQAGQVRVDAKTASRRRGEDSLSDKESSEVDTKERLLTKSASNLLKKAGSTSTPNTARPLSAARQRRDSKIAKKVSSTIYGEEVEQVAEDMTDAAKLSAMGEKNKAPILAALARYKKVGDINKLSPGHRTLVSSYLEKAGGIGSLGNSIQRKVLKPQ